MSSPLGGLPELPMNSGARFTPPWAGWFSTVQRILTADSSSGPTTGRPTSGQYVGMPYFDTTLGYPVWLKTPGSSPVWVNATGSPV
jgi:hypothetical protein